ncbi:MAG: 3-deoxy-D-manno-octulosonic acid transferase [Candidatus Omnitrophica bacterium]|nr:3-deoxy-D-manno-octulosonic acid transferase [Candidatus Omnitrophota bacterium]
MTIIYDIIFILLHLLYLPFFIFRRKFHKGFLSRLGFLPKDIISKLKGNKHIWVHAVSVGEVLVASKLIDVLRQRWPDQRIVISTVTPTGNKIARSLAKENDSVIYFPLDFSFIVKHVIDLIKPTVFITAETEIWPNIISYLYAKKVPVIVINGRISKRSFSGYKKIRFLLRRTLRKIALFCMQTSEDAERIIYLGAPKNKVKVVGNLKFDEKFSEHSCDPSCLGLKEDDMLIIAGSTHHNEEEITFKVYREAIKNFPRLKLMIAPRHPERADAIADLISSNNFKVIRFSSIKNEKINLAAYANYVFLVDTIGDLKSLYNLATLVFVGGSLVNKGGHNIIEPAYFSKPIIFGPHMSNFQDMADLFLKKNSVIQVKNEKELASAIKMLLENRTKRQQLGQDSRRIVDENKGATERTADLIKETGFSYARISL